MCIRDSFSVAELLARVRVALRRVAFDETEEEAGETYRNGDLAIDFDAKVVVRGDDEIHLTPIEYKLLVLLAHNTGKVLTHNYILKEVWGAALASDLPSLRVFMATLDVYKRQVYGLGGVIVPFAAIKALDALMVFVGVA